MTTINSDLPVLTHVTSSNIAAIGHHPASATMFVRFNNGGTYAYKNVTGEEFAQIQGAESIGKAFHKLVKAAGKPFEKLT